MMLCFLSAIIPFCLETLKMLLVERILLFTWSLLNKKDLPSNYFNQFHIQLCAISEWPKRLILKHITLFSFCYTEQKLILCHLFSQLYSLTIELEDYV